MNSRQKARKDLPLPREFRDAARMPDITNLRRYRKQLARDSKRAQATENAAKSGQTKAARLLAATREEKSRRMLDQHRLGDQEDG